MLCISYLKAFSQCVHMPPRLLPTPCTDNVTEYANNTAIQALPPKWIINPTENAVQMGGDYGEGVAEWCWRVQRRGCRGVESTEKGVQRGGEYREGGAEKGRV